MRIESIKLKNIRSYLDEKIEFQDGTILFSGDIGSGKSTVLIALEFALFGLNRKDLTGSKMLRHGCDDAEVYLDMKLKSDKIKIKRSLKRRESISQASGSIEINGYYHSYSATELSAKVLSLLGYPEEIIQKKFPLFRYTVYTPQEHMKEIMSDKFSEERLSIIRKIFDIEKYNTIKTNTALLLKELRADKRELEGFSSDLEEKSRELQKLIDESETKNKSLTTFYNRLETLRNEFETENQKKASLNESYISLQEKKQNHVKKKTEISNCHDRTEQINKTMEIYSKKISDINIEPCEKPEEIDSNSLLELRKHHEKLFSEKIQLSDMIARFKNILSRGECSVCRQKVFDSSSYAAAIDSYQKNLDRIVEELNSIITQIIAKELTIKKNQEKTIRWLRYQNDMEILKNYKDQVNKLQDEFRIQKYKASEIEKEFIILENELNSLSCLEVEIKNQNLLYEVARKSLMTAETDFARKDQEVKGIQKQIIIFKHEIEKKKMAREKIQRILIYSSWLENTFSMLMETIEKYQLESLQSEFNEVFQKWFSLLIEDQMSVRIDERFSPVIEQNNYETDYENLSGGEKTAVSLSYRLSLNQIINSEMSSINTKNILILDEPTDGFSSEQLDKLRNVLNELKLNQIIIVSHDSKIDSFVDHVVRISKENHISSVVGQ